MSWQIILKHLTSNEIALEDTPAKERAPVLVLRLIAIALLVAVLTIHVRSVRVFRWEQSVTGGVLVTYVVAMGGLAVCAGADRCGGRGLQAYLCSSGAALLLINAGAIWHRWHRSGELTQVVAELLFALGVPLRRHVMFKVFLCVAAAVILMLDLALVPFLTAIRA